MALISIKAKRNNRGKRDTKGRTYKQRLQFRLAAPQFQGASKFWPGV